VDVDLGVGLRGIEAVRDAAARLGGAVQVEIVAFPQDGVMRRPGVLELLEEAGAAVASNSGGLDTAAIERDPLAQRDGLFRIAAERDCGIDIDLHDGGTLGRFEYALIAELTREYGRVGRVNVSHGFALSVIPL